MASPGQKEGSYISETFLKRDDARRWATETEGRIDYGKAPTPVRAARLKTFGELIDLYVDDVTAWSVEAFRRLNEG